MEVFLERFINAIKDEVGECRCEDEACCGGGGSGGCDDGGYDVVESEEGAAKNGEGGGGDKSEGDGIVRNGEEMGNHREEGEQGATDGLIEEQGEITVAKRSNDEEMKQEDGVGDEGDECRCEEKSCEEHHTENVEEGSVQLPSIEQERPHDEPDKNANCYHEDEEEAVPRSGYGPTRDCDGSIGNQSSRINRFLSPQRRHSGQQQQKEEEKKEEEEEEGDRKGYEEISRLKCVDNSAGVSRGATIAASSSPLDATSTKFAVSSPSGASPVTAASSKSAAKATSASASATVRKYIEDANFQFVPRSRRGSGGTVSGRGSERGRGTSAKCDDADDDGSQWQKFYFE